jgi:hypothetical protein
VTARAIAAAPTADVARAIRRAFDQRNLQRWQGFVPGRQTWAQETGRLHQDGTAKWVAARLHWMGVIRNAVWQLEPRLLGGAAFHKLTGGQPMYVHIQALAEQNFSLEPGGVTTSGACLEKFGEELTEHITWTHAKRK